MVCYSCKLIHVHVCVVDCGQILWLPNLGFPHFRVCHIHSSWILTDIYLKILNFECLGNHFLDPPLKYKCLWRFFFGISFLSKIPTIQNIVHYRNLKYGAWDIMEKIKGSNKAHQESIGKPWALQKGPSPNVLTTSPQIRYRFPYLISNKWVTLLNNWLSQCSFLWIWIYFFLSCIFLFNFLS